MRPQLVINYDQTGVYIRPNHSQTFEVRGSKQVSVTGNDEKRAYTLGVASAANGTLLPLEQIWSGLTKKSLPKAASADGFAEAKDRGFHFAFAASKKKTSHFSTLKTMKEWLAFIVKPYIDSVIEADPALDSDQKCIIYIDVYPVHTGEPFRSHVFEEYPNIILIFVPNNCTGIFQPQDVGIQRVAKHHLRQSMLEYLVRCHQAQIISGITPENVTFSSSFPVLRDASVRSCVSLYDWLISPAGHQIVTRSWAKCEVPDKPKYNLSYECLTSRDSRKALRKYLIEDKILADEIKARMGSIDLPDLPADGDISPEGIDDCGELRDDDERVGTHQPEDDTDIPLGEVVQVALGIHIDPPQGGLVSTHVIEEDPAKGLSTADAEENIWSFNDRGEMWTSIEEISSQKGAAEDDGDFEPSSDDESS